MKRFGILIPDNNFLKILLIISFYVIVAAFVPAFGFISLVFLPMLIIFYSAIAGIFRTAAAFLIPLLIISLISHLWQLNTPYPIIFMMGIVSIITAILALKNSSVEKTVIYPALIIMGAISSYFLYAGWEQSVNPWHLVSQFVAQSIEQNIDLLSQLQFDKEDINSLKDNKLIFISVFTTIFPALAVIGSIVIVWVNVLMGKDILRKANIILPRLAELSRWKAPEFIIWLFIASGSLLLLPNEQIRLFSLNILILVCFIYLLQGLAIISFFFQNKNVPLFFRYLFYFLIAVQQFLMIPIVAAGLFDIWVDFRRLFPKNQASV